jgi:hypothetical protein
MAVVVVGAPMKILALVAFDCEKVKLSKILMVEVAVGWANIAPPWP